MHHLLFVLTSQRKQPAAARVAVLAELELPPSLPKPSAPVKFSTASLESHPTSPSRGASHTIERANQISTYHHEPLTAGVFVLTSGLLHFVLAPIR